MLNVFGGSGYIGTHFCAGRSDVVVNQKYDYQPKTDKLLYLISTTTNHNVLTDPLLDIDTNLNVLISVLRQCKPSTTVNFVSSWFVYGDVQCPANEQAPCNPKGFYSITKRTAEQLLISYCNTHNINYRILRLGNVVGGKDNNASEKKNVLQNIINRLANNQSVDLYQGGHFVRDYIHIEDVVAAINLVIESSQQNEVYNIGNGIPVTLRSVVEYARHRLNSHSVIRDMEPTPFVRQTHVDTMYLDISRLQKLGYKPKYSVYDAVDQIIEESWPSG